MKSIRIILSILFVFTLSCTEKSYSQQNRDSVQLPGFEKIDNTDAFIIRYSNVIINVNGTTIKLPMYGGTYGDIEYDKLKLGKHPKDVFVLQTIYLPVKKGYATETFRDIIRFYKKSLLKNVDINKPSDLYTEGNSFYTIIYAFEYKGVPSRMMIDAKVINATNKVENFQLKEEDGFIGLTFSIGGKNP